MGGGAACRPSQLPHAGKKPYLAQAKPECGIDGGWGSDYIARMKGDALSELSRSEKILAEKTVCVLLVRGEDPDGAPIYAYVGVRADKLKPFMEAQTSGLFYPEEFGVIIEAGHGEPSAEVRQRMEVDYGFNHDGMLDIPDAEQATKVAAELSVHANTKRESDA